MSIASEISRGLNLDTVVKSIANANRALKNATPKIPRRVPKIPRIP